MILARGKVAMGCLLVVVSVAAPAAAQQRRYPIRGFKVLKIGGSARTSGVFEDLLETDSDSGQTRRDKQTTFAESIGLNAKGYIYHPNLLDWSTSLRLVLDQDREVTNTTTRINNGQNQSYSLQALILKEKPISFRLAVVRNTDTVRRNTSDRFESESDNLAFEMMTKGKFPLSLLLETGSSEIIDAGREEQDRTRHLLFRITDRREADWRTQFAYDHKESDQVTTSFGTEIDQAYKADDLSLRNSWRFGPKTRKHTLTGGVRVYQRRGYYLNEIFSTDQRLNLRHSKTLSTFYQASLSTDKTESENDRILSGEAGFTKSFYKSLHVNGRVYFSDTTFVDGTEDIRGGNLDFDYRKKTPIGLFTSSLALSRETETEQSVAGKRTAAGDTVILSGVAFVVLSETNIMQGTVVVMNQTRTITYTEDADYRLRTIGATTEIARALSGSTITDGQTVLVDYVIDVAQEAEFVTDNVNWSSQLQLKILPISILYSNSTSDQRLISGDSPGNLDKIVVQTGRIQWRAKGLTAALEHTITDQRLSPPKTETSVDVAYTKRISRDTTFGLNGQASWLQYRQAEAFGLEPGGDFKDSYSASANMTTKLWRNALLRVDGLYSYSRGQDNESEATVGAEFKWKYGKFEFSVNSKYSVYRQESVSGTESSVGFNIVRKF